MLSSITANVKWLFSKIPFIGKYFGASKIDNKEPLRDTKVVKLLHENKTTWNEGIVSKLRQFSTRIYGSFFQNNLFKLFLTDKSVPAFDPSKFPSYTVDPVDIREHGTTKPPVSLKYHIYKHSDDLSKAKPVAILTHGVKTTGRNMGKLAKQLLQMDNRVLIGDLVGFGANADKKLNELNLINDVKNTILEGMNLSHGAPLTLLSHSMGTALQTNALAKIFEEEEKSGEFNLKVKDLVLISPWDKVSSIIHDFHEHEANWEKIKDAVSPDDSVSDFIHKNHDRAEEIAKTVFGSNWDTLDSLFKILELNKMRPPEFRLKNLNVIHGQKDPFISHNRSKNLIGLVLALYKNGDKVLPNSRFCLIRDGNHFDMQSDESKTYFPITNVAQLLKSPPNGIESGEANFGNADYTKTQTVSINNSDIPALAA